MKRKNFIILTVTAAAGIAIPTWYYKYGNLEYNTLLKEPELLSHIWDTKTIIEIGKIYREQYPDENNERKLVKFLSNSNPSVISSTIEYLQKKIQDDFKADRTVIIDGWILSVTEARQCALFSLK